MEVITQLFGSPDRLSVAFAVASVVLTLVLRLVSGRVFRTQQAMQRAVTALYAEQDRLETERLRAEDYAQGAAGMHSRQQRRQECDDGEAHVRDGTGVVTCHPPAGAPPQRVERPRAQRPRPEVALWLARLVEDVGNVDVLPPTRTGPKRQELRPHAHAG